MQEYQMLTEIYYNYCKLRNLADSWEMGENLADS